MKKCLSIDSIHKGNGAEERTSRMPPVLCLSRPTLISSPNHKFDVPVSLRYHNIYLHLHLHIVPCKICYI